MACCSAFRLALILVALFVGAECHQTPVVSVDSDRTTTALGGDLGSNCAASGSCVSSDTVGLLQVSSEAALQSGTQAIAPSLALVQKSLQRIIKDHMVDKAARLNKVNQNMGKLVADIVNGKTAKNDPTLTAALDAIRESIEEVFSGGEEQHAADQAIVDQARTDIENCDEDLDDLSGYMDAASIAATEHIVCRTEEATMKGTKEEKHDDFNLTVLREPTECKTSVEEWNDDAISDRAAAVKVMSDWVDELKVDKAEWDTAVGAHSSQRTLCNDNQREYEKTFCAWHSKLTTQCEAYGNCRTTMTTIRNTTHDDVEKGAISRRAAFRAGMHILCFLKVLNLTSHEEQVDELEVCSNYTVTDDLLSNLTMVYPAIPPLQPCDVYPVEIKPCDDEWLTHYQDQAWFAHAPAAPCEACIE